jgi:hypothetical protein
MNEEQDVIGRVLRRMTTSTLFSFPGGRSSIAEAVVQPETERLVSDVPAGNEASWMVGTR